jgi:hypothetical protein
VAFIPTQRAMTLTVAGRPREAIAPAESALRMADSGELPPGQSRFLRREALRARITAEAQSGNAEAAQKTAAALEQDASARPDDPDAQSAMHYARGQLAMARTDVAGARAAFAQCSPEDALCGWQAVVAAEKARDKDTSAEARATLLKLYQRDPAHLVIRSRLAPPKST